MKIDAKKIRIEFNNGSEDFWEVTSGSGIVFDEAMRMIAKAWEKHDASAEPLIKDEKIRKVVRAWVDNLRPYMCDGVITFYVDTTYCTFQVDVWGDHNTRDIAELDLVFDYNGLEDNTTYTTDELCGGEKE